MIEKILMTCIILALVAIGYIKMFPEIHTKGIMKLIDQAVVVVLVVVLALIPVLALILIWV